MRALSVVRVGPNSSDVLCEPSHTRAVGMVCRTQRREWETSLHTRCREIEHEFVPLRKETHVELEGSVDSHSVCTQGTL